MSTVNTIMLNNKKIAVDGPNRPYSNDFVVLQVRGQTNYAGEAAVEVVVQATDTSQEPGRQYLCVYTPAGRLLACQC
jgi:hypothetical protein